MLTIRAEQMQAFARDARGRFEGRLRLHMVSVFGAAAEEADLPSAIDSAQSFGIVKERDVARYAEVLFRHSGAFLAHALSKDAQNILLAYGVEASEKLQRLEEWLKREPEPVNARAIQQ